MFTNHNGDIVGNQQHCDVMRLRKAHEIRFPVISHGQTPMGFNAPQSIPAPRWGYGSHRSRNTKSLHPTERSPPQNRKAADPAEKKTLVGVSTNVTIWLFNIAMERSTIFKNGKPSISMGHLYHGYVK